MPAAGKVTLIVFVTAPPVPFGVETNEQRKSVDYGDCLPQRAVHLPTCRGRSTAHPKHDLVFVLNLNRVRATLRNPKRPSDTGVEVLIPVRFKGGRK